MILILMGIMLLRSKAIDKDLFITEEVSQFYVNVRMPAGTNIYATNKVLSEIERKIMSLPKSEVSAIITSAGKMITKHEWIFDTSVGQIMVDLVEKEYRQRTMDEIISDLRPRLQDIPGIKSLDFKKQRGGPPTPKAVELKVQGKHFNILRQIANRIERKLSTTEGVYDIADDLPQMIRISPQIPSLLRPMGAFIGRRMMSKNIQVSDRVTLSSATLKSAYNIPEDKSEYIPNGVDTELFHSYPCQQEREKLHIEGCFVLGYVGVLREWVDFEPVFAAVAELAPAYPDIRILIVGEEGLERNRELARRCGVENKVIFTGTVPYAQVPQYISCMDVGLIPRKAGSVAESMVPLKLFEYMACEKPVICTELGGIRKAVQSQVLYASNKEQYKQVITKLYHGDELRREMGVSGRKMAEKDYDWANLASRLEVLLEKVQRR